MNLKYRSVFAIYEHYINEIPKHVFFFVCICLAFLFHHYVCEFFWSTGVLTQCLVLASIASTTFVMPSALFAVVILQIQSHVFAWGLCWMAIHLTQPPMLQELLHNHTWSYLENYEAGHHGLIPVILDTQKAEIRKIKVQSQPGQLACKTQAWKKNPSWKKGLMEWLKM
jgi:hypothetical protein